MEKESFVDPQISKLLNEHFVSIKVDREQSPTVDAVYMAATQAMNQGRGGWPMTVLAAPNKQPFFTGTYLPPYDSPRGTGFFTLLERVADLWHDERDSVLAHASELADYLQRAHVKRAPDAPARTPSGDHAEGAWWRAPARQALEQAAADFDPRDGGFGAPPKFLATPTLRLLVRCGWQDSDERAQSMLAQTLSGMTRGGLWDWVGGGFSRYSTDPAWRVPHFEKMLYDNALLARTLLEASQASCEPRWAEYARDTLDFVTVHLCNGQGGFLTAIDADSEHVEGLYYTWPYDEALGVLSPSLGEDAAVAWMAALGATRAGNWENGRNILHAALGRSAEKAAPTCPSSTTSWPAVRALLAAARGRRVPPQTDDKVLVGHNGLMITAFAAAAKAFFSAEDLATGCRAADFVWANCRRSTGGLCRSWRMGQTHGLGSLEDYAYYAEGLLALYEAGASLDYLQRASQVLRFMLSAFRDDEGGALFDSDEAEEPLMFRPIEGHDDATPSANAVAAAALWRMSVHSGDPLFARAADGIVNAWRREATRMPSSYTTLLRGCLECERAETQWVWVGRGSPLASPLWREANRRFAPHIVSAHTDGVAPASQWPLLQRKAAHGNPYGAIYLCQERTCSPPILTVPEVAAALGPNEGRPRLIEP